MHPSRLIGWLAVLAMVVCGRADAATWHVSPGKSIQTAMDAAAVGDTIIVRQGVYREAIQFHGKDLVLQSEDPTSETVRLATIIRNPHDAPLATGVVTFNGTETEACVLSGVTIRGGWKVDFDDPPGGGIEGNGTRATIQFCRIYGNGAPYGGGIAECHGLIEDCEIIGNSAYGVCLWVPDPYYPCRIFGLEGGGLYDCDGIIRRCVVSRNEATSSSDDIPHGGGFFQCDGVIEDCEITENVSARRDGYGEGGAMYHCKALIRGNRFVANTKGPSSLLSCPGPIVENEFRDNMGFVLNMAALPSTIIERNAFFNNTYCILGSVGVIQNNIFVGGKYAPIEASRGLIENNTIITNSKGLGSCSATVRNCIFYNPDGLPVTFFQDNSTFENCLITGYTKAGSGAQDTNRDGNPRFVDPANGDYRLRADSPLIDAGRMIEDLSIDLDGNPRPVKSVDWQARGDGSGFDIGSYEYQAVVPQPPPAAGVGWAVK